MSGGDLPFNPLCWKTPAERELHRILCEMVMWMFAKPEDHLLALGEAFRRLSERAAERGADPCFRYRAAQVEYILDLALHKAAEAERDGYITITLVGSDTDAVIH